MKKTIYVMLAVLAFLASSIGCQNIEKLDKKDKPLTTSKSRAYPNSTVKVQASFPVPVKGILLGTKDILKESKIGPDESGNWEDTLTLSDIAPGKNKVVVVGKPSDGSKSIVYENALEVLPYPKLSFEYDRNNVKTSQTVKVTSESNLTYVTFVLPDGAKQPFKKVDSHTFTVDTILPETDFSITVADEIDVLETHEEHSLEFFAGKKIYVHLSAYKGPTTFFSCLLSDVTIASDLLTITNISIKDDYRDNIQKFNEKFEPHNYSSMSLLGLSPNKRYIYGAVGEAIWPTNYYEEGYSVRNIIVTYYIVYDILTKEYHHFGTRYLKEFNNQSEGKTVKESGHQYFVVGWKDNLMLMVERTPENKFYNPYTSDVRVRNMDEFNPVVPWATARGVALNLDTFELKDTDLVKPYRPWAVFADQALGIVGYTGPYDVGIFDKRIDYTTPFYRSLAELSTSLFVSDLEGKHVYDIQKEANKAAIDSRYYIGSTSLIGGCVYNKKICSMFIINTPEKVASGEWRYPDGSKEGPTPPYRENVWKNWIAFFDMDKGEIVKLVDVSEIKSRNNAILRITCSDPDSPPTIAFRPGILAQFNGEKFEIISKPMPRPFSDDGLIIR